MLSRRATLAGLAGSALASKAAAAAGPQVLHQIPGPLLIEGIAYDGRRLYLGAVKGRKVISLDKGGRPSTVIEGLRFGVFGMACDAKGVLWAATADPDDRKSELLAIEPARRRIIARYAPPTQDRMGPVFGDVALASNGAVYVSDSKGGGVAVLAPGAKSLDWLVPPNAFAPPGSPPPSADQSFRSPQGMVARTADVIVADYSQGLFRVDRQNGRRTSIPGGDLRGVDGLTACRGGLVAIQNGGRVPRVLKLTLTGDAITKVDVVAEGGALHEPTLGVVFGERLLFIGHSQWGDLDDKGALSPGAAATAVMGLDLA